MPEGPTSEDYASVQRAADELQRRGWRGQFSVPAAVERWSVIVETVEHGYMMTIDDYTNDLSIRRWSEEARQYLTARAQKWLDEGLAPLDARFRDATTPLSKPFPGAGPGWWEGRLPKLLVGELEEDVRRMGLR